MNNINKMFKNWGSKKQILPSNNEIIKEKILSQVPFSVEAYQNIEKKKINLPWTSFAFATVAIVLFIANPIFSTKNKPILVSNFRDSFTTEEQNLVEKNIKKESKSLFGNYELNSFTPTSSDRFGAIGLDEEMNNVYLPTYPNDDSFLKKKTDTREFLKIYYNAEIKTRKVSEVVSSVRVAIVGMGGRVDSLNAGKDSGYINFSVPASKFEIFKDQIKELTNKNLFVEQISSTNLLPQKQAIEEDEARTQKSLSSLKSEKSKIISEHEDMINFYNYRIDGLNRESGLLQVEWQTANATRKLEITARLAQIQGEKNSINIQILNEDNNYQNKLSSINSKIKVFENSLENIKEEDRNLLDNISMVTGTISVTHVNLWQYVDAFIPGPLLAWIFTLCALAFFVRYWFLMRFI